MFLVITSKETYKQKQTEDKLSRRMLFSAMVTGIAVAVVFTVTPWNYIPTDVTVIAIIEYDCVGESQYGRSLVVPECSTKVGKTVSATFNVPSGKLNGYWQELEGR